MYEINLQDYALELKQGEVIVHKETITCSIPYGYDWERSDIELANLSQ